MTGARFTSRTGTDAGTDTIVWIWAQTPSGGTLRQARVWKVAANLIAATIPDDVPFGMYLIWVENAYGPSTPICMNRTQPQWIGPLDNRVPAGGTKRVFGKNISRGHGTSESNVYIQPAAGGALIPCTTTAVEPFAVAFTVPPGTTNGNYRVYVHNGQGGQYGWGNPLDLVVANEWVRGAAQTTLSPSVGGNDTAALQNAVNLMSSNPNGGTVNLSAGQFVVTSLISIPSNVRIAGAGRDQTTINFRLSNPSQHCMDFNGSHVALQNLTLYYSVMPGNPVNNPMIIGAVGADYSQLLSIRVNGDYGMECKVIVFHGEYAEIADSEFYQEVGTFPHGWVHDNTFWGAPHQDAYSGTEFAVTGASYVVCENNYAATPAWPVGPNNSLNYSLFLTADQKLKLQICKRLYGGGGSMSYVAHNNTKDVAVEDNKGEMILFHGGGGAWWGQCVSTTGNTTTVRTDGLVDGQSVTLVNGATPLTGSLPIPNTYLWGVPMEGLQFVIIDGTGLGQLRTIVSHTANSVTLDSPWRVPPDSTSKAVIVGLFQDHIIYDNELNAFPAGYDFVAIANAGIATASTAIVIDGLSWNIEAEGNVSHRTKAAMRIAGDDVGISYWNSFRDNQCYEVDANGDWLTSYNPNPYGYGAVGNRYLGGTTQIVGQSPAYGVGFGLRNISHSQIGNIAEGLSLSGGYPGISVSEENLVRNNNVSVRYVSSPPQPVYLNMSDANPILVNNTYSGSSQVYFLAPGCTFAQKPLPEYSSVKFGGYVGNPVQAQIIPVANAGIVSMTWTVTASDPWINASIQSNSTLPAESTLGRLVVSVDTTGMSAGKRWGSVTINTGTKTAKIGVCVDLASGTPSNQQPVASFTATPPAGAAPLPVVFDASTSYDPDGLLASYSWDFGDSSYGSGVTTTHTYTGQGTFTPVLTVTDSLGVVGSSWTNVSVSPTLTSVAVTGSPKAPIDAGIAVTLTAVSVGGYQVQYQFMVNSGSGWTTVRGYSTVPSYTWTPTSSGYYRLKVYARNTGSNAVYDVASSEVGYSVGQLPINGLSLWLRADAGVTKDVSNNVSNWADQSNGGNSVSSGYAPSYVSDSGNGKPAVRFSSSNSCIMSSVGRAMNGTSNFTCFALAKYNSAGLPGTSEYILWNGSTSTSTGGYGWNIDTSGRIVASWNSYSGRIASTSSIANGQYHVISSRLNNGSHQLWLNGTSIGTASKTDCNFTVGYFSVGNKPTTSGTLDGDIQEIIVYNRALSDTERANVESYLATRYQPQTKQWIPEVKSLPDGTSVALSGAKVAIASSGTFSDQSYYIEEPDRFAGMKVVGYSGQPSVGVGDRITLSGWVDTDANGEKTLFVSGIPSQTAGDPLGALGMTNKTLSGSGLLVRIWGRVIDKGSGYLTISDGSSTGVRVELSGLVSPLTGTPDVGAFLSVTGTAGLSAGVPVVRPRANADVLAY